MPPLVFRPNRWSCLAGLFALSVMGAGSVWAAHSLRNGTAIGQALIVFVPLLWLWHLGVSMTRRDWHECLIFDEETLSFHDGQALQQLLYSDVVSARLARGQAFDAQSPEYLILMRRDGGEPMKWNIADFRLPVILNILSELASRANLPVVVITGHQGGEKELRLAARNWGVVTLVPETAEKAGLGQWYQTFLFEPHPNARA